MTNSSTSQAETTILLQTVGQGKSMDDPPSQPQATAQRPLSESTCQARLRIENNSIRFRWLEIFGRF